MYKNEQEPLISVVINCYNGEKYLREAVDSVISQTYENWEIIFWDNQSTDASAEIVKSYQDNRIYYFYADEHVNLGHARNLAFEQTKGEWVGFLDVDDFWFPEKLSSQMKNMSHETSELGMIYCRCEYFCDKSVVKKQFKGGRKVIPSCLRLPQESLVAELYKGNFIPATTVLFNKDALHLIGGIPLSYTYSPDYYMTLRIASKYAARAVDKVLCAYRLHDSNMSLYSKEEGYRESIDIVKRVAPEEKAHELNLCNVSRYVIYLLFNMRIYDASREIKSIGIFGFLKGVNGLIKYRLHNYN